MNKLIPTLLLAIVAFAPSMFAQAPGPQTVRVKDIVSYKGTGDETIDGMALVVGLKGTGDKNDKLAQNAARAYMQNKNNYKYLERLKDEDFGGGNVAYVRVSAVVNERTTVAGTRLTATVAALGDTKSLSGGVLVNAELTHARSKRVLAIAAGSLNAGQVLGAAAREADVSKASVDATLMVDLPEITFFETVTDEFGNVAKRMTLALLAPDAATATAIAAAINDAGPLLGLGRIDGNSMAKAESIDRVVVTIPRDYHGREVEFRALIEAQSVNSDSAALVTISLSTGTIFISGHVRVLPCSVTVAGVTITSTPTGDLPAKPAAGAEIPDPSVAINQPATSLVDMMNMLNALGMTAGEKVEVLRAIWGGGHLQGKLVNVP